MNIDKTSSKTSPRVAVVHDWLYVYGGAERVLEMILQAFPQADVFSLIDNIPDDKRQFLGGRPVRTSFLQNLPFARRRHRAFLPLMPMAIEQLDLSGYDLIISSHYAVAKGVLTGPDQYHACYCHSPIRYAWDLQHQYLREAGLTRGIRSWLARALLHYIRMWDSRTAAGVDQFIANSNYIARRIKKVYRRDSIVIHPPVDVATFPMRSDKEDFYVAASRMVEYKRLGLIVDAFTRHLPDRKLVVIGDGPEFKRIQALASPNVTLLGYQPTEVLRDHLQRARAYVFAAEEDFGILPVEAQACGTPVIAYGRGGALETVRSDGPHPTGMFFDSQTPEAIAEAVVRFENAPPIAAEDCRRHAESFAPERFIAELRATILDGWTEYQGAKSQRPKPSSLDESVEPEFSEV